MRVLKAIRAINTSAVFQNDRGEKWEVLCDYLQAIEWDDGSVSIVPVKVISLADVDHYKGFQIRDHNGRVLSQEEIEQRFGQEDNYTDPAAQWGHC